MSSSDEAMKESLKNTFEPHYKEIQRRSDITQQGLHDDKTFSKVKDVADYDFQSADQKFIVFSLSQQQFAPIPIDLKNPALCVYGAFPTREEAVEYARDVVLPTHGQISVFADESHKWIAAVKNPENLQESYVNSHVEKLLRKHDEMIHANLKDFQENVAEQKTGKSESSGEKKETPTPSVEGKSHRISGKLDIRGQKLAVVSFVKDEADIPEFLFRVYAFFDHEEDANAYIRNVCGDKVEDFDIDVVSTCQWIYPQNMTYENVNKEIFRSDELDRIMKNHKNNPKEVAKFQKSMASEGESSVAPAVDVTDTNIV